MCELSEVNVSYNYQKLSLQLSEESITFEQLTDTPLSEINVIFGSSSELLGDISSSMVNKLTFSSGVLQSY